MQKGESQMEDKKIETPKRVLARLVADQLDTVEGGLPPQETYTGISTEPWGSYDGTDGYQDRDDV
jgi:hypothetical protein